MYNLFHYTNAGLVLQRECESMVPCHGHGPPKVPNFWRASADICTVPAR